MISILFVEVLTQEMAGAGLPDYLLFNRHSYEGAFHRNARTDMDITDMQHRSIHSDPGVHFDQQKLENSLIKRHFMKQLEESSRGAVIYRHDVGSRRQVYPSAGVDDFSFGQPKLLQSMYAKYSTKPCLFRADSSERHTGLERHKNFNKINMLPLDHHFHDRKYSNQGRVVSTSLSSSATSLYSEEEILSRYSQNPSPVPSVTLECPSLPSQSRKDSIYDIEHDPDWAEILRELSIKKEQQNIENNNVAAIDSDSSSNPVLDSKPGEDTLKCTSKPSEKNNAGSALPTVLEETSLENTEVGNGG